MDMTWSLDDLYTGFDSEEFKNDFKSVQEEIEKIKSWTKSNLDSQTDVVSKIEQFIKMQNDFGKYSLLSEYANLVLSVDSENEKATKTLDTLDELYTELSDPTVLFEQFIAAVENLEELIETSEILKAHRFYLHEIKANSQYLLSEKEELIIAKMTNTGSSSWSKQWEQLSATLLVDIIRGGESKKEPLAIVRNYAYDSNKNLRKKAYEAELKAYEKIDKSAAFSLNSIKGEVISICKLRGYESPLSMTLIDSRMDKQILDAMFDAIKEYLPVFRKYFKKKAKLLGHKKSLPFYDLFAPLGDVDMTFSYTEAIEFIIKNFTAFSQKLGDYAKHAFESNWVDAEPHDGKRGGAFCANLHPIKQSRILANFTGSFNDVLTLAHELGHGYHGECLNEESYLNSDYPMPIAETASTLCETIVVNAALKTASKEEAFVILENDISGMAQVTVDIYSRYLFETQLFENRTEGGLSVSELKELMISAQKTAYGDGLDHNFLHPYMWVCKPHYYYADSNFYNFPYAYGLLFSKGLYAAYEDKGQDFIKKYDNLLASTGKNNLKDVAKQVDIDVTDKNFWLGSLKAIETEIEEFLSL